MSFIAEPTISPVLVASRAKGRLDHAFRQQGTPLAFSRRTGFRSLGKNTSDTVLGYLARQYDRVELVDARYVASLQAAAWENPDFDFSDPQPSSHGRYWYDLHAVCVTEDRVHVGPGLEPFAIRDAVLAWGQALGEMATPGSAGVARPGVRSLAVLHDHLHIAFRGAVGRSPMEMAEDLWTRLNRACGCRMFSDRVYVGSFSEYSLNALG